MKDLLIRSLQEVWRQGHLLFVSEKELGMEELQKAIKTIEEK